MVWLGGIEPGRHIRVGRRVIAERLERALRAAVIPILGVSIGTPTDRSTWRIHYAPSATAQQQVDGEAIKATFDPNAPATIDAENAARFQLSAADKDRLADIALMIRYKDITAWNAMTNVQKRDAVRQQQAVWENIRDFIEKNV